MEDRLRDEFPVNWEDDDYVTRREFFRFLTVASAGLALGSTGIAGWTMLSRNERNFQAMRIAKTSEVGLTESFAFTYPRKEDLCILIQSQPGQFCAFSRRCTHLSCPVDYQPDHKRIYCPCHNGAFSLEDGRVLQGPPPRPLPRIKLELRGDDIYAVGIIRVDA